MSDNLAPKFAQLSVRSDKVEEESPGFSRTNGEEEKGKNNPWKLITEKIKWQNYEVGNATFAIRGRGSYMGPSLSAPHYTFRRGGPSFRGRGSDAVRPRGANGLYARNPFRAPGLRNPVEPRDEKIAVTTTMDAETVTSHQENRHKVSPTDPAPDDQGQCIANEETSVSGPVPPSTGTLSPFTDTSLPVRSVVTQSSQIKRSYRDRMSAPQAVSTQPSTTGVYEAGPVGRARRCYMRQHQAAYVSEPETPSATHPLVSTAIQPLVQYQPVAPITYYIPGTPAVGTALWGPNLQLTASSGSHHTVQTNVAPISVANPALIPVPTPQPGPSVGSVDGSQPILNDLSLTSTVLPHTLPRGTGDLPSFKGLNVSEVQVEVVDVDKVIAFVNEHGWQNVIFPPSLKEHPAVAASIRAALSKMEAGEVIESGVRRSEEANHEDTGEKPSGKPDDVIIVEGRFFFVPRNVNRTKFLKFVSKSDYIRHHVEYYFSRSNLNRDIHLASILAANQDVCPISELLQFNRLRFVSTTKTELLEAVASSPSVAVTYSTDGSPIGIVRIMAPAPSAPSTTMGDTPFTQNSTESSLTPPNATHVSETTTNSVSAVNTSTSLVQTATPNGDAAQPSRPVHLISTASTVSYSTTHTTTNSAIPMPPLIATPGHIPAQYLQSPAFVLNSVPRMEFNNASPGSVTYPGFTASQLQQYYSQSDAGAALPQAASITFPNQQNLYPHHQALVAAAANQPSLLSSPNQPNLQPPDGSAAFMTAIYRIATPGHPSPTVGAFLPPVGNTTALAAPNNSPVFFQFLPTAHPSPGYLGSAANNPSSLFNRPVGALNPGGVWIPVATPGGGIAVPNITPTQPFPHYVTLSHGPHAITVPNAVGASFGGTIPHPMQATTLPQIPTALIDALYAGQADQNMSRDLVVGRSVKMNAASKPALIHRLRNTLKRPNRSDLVEWSALRCFGKHTSRMLMLITGGRNNAAIKLNTSKNVELPFSRLSVYTFGCGHNGVE
ncbi:unnamed protein product [Echinostoma caproni]|uniref:HTH La-type RNA-binding domain-containing protein n=1 Tax=Echinostoma caproni TaxID=27848 RepID=A0A183AMW8_9TREM|nr:unnamed protein product [Echinostoma caproni]